MELLVDIFNYFTTAILIGICGAWAFLIKAMTDSFRLTPYLDKFENISHETPKVSIILPARNEEEFIGKCLQSLIKQDYENYEIIVIDDSSEDSTPDIISRYAKKNQKLFQFMQDQNQMDGWERIGHAWKDIEKPPENYCYLQMQIPIILTK